MMTNIEKTELTNPTLLKIEEWIQAINSVDTADRPIFNSADELADSLERWRMDFIIESKELEYHWGDLVTVACFGEEAILVSDQRSGEFIKILFTTKQITL
ncbi:hypothetical protein [Belliella pelovolcani]|uniref:hypothetical protein n=1 Tax=Belliella pelovolcani TaxID=529505 RepID=UPI00391DCFB0